MAKLTMTAFLASKNPSFFLKTLQDLPGLSPADDVTFNGDVNEGACQAFRGFFDHG
jgi:hypothetical protein